MSDLRLVFWILCGVAGILIGWGLAGENTPAVLVGALVLLGCGLVQEWAERRDPRFDRLRYLYLTLFLVAGFLVGWGLAAGSLLGVVAGVALALAAGGIKTRTKSRERHDAEHRR